MNDVAAATTYVALLRGINLGNRNRMSMRSLHAILHSMGGTRIRTLLQSGNALFDHQGGDVHALADALEARIAEELTLTVPCVVRPASDLRRVVNRNPFAETGFDPSRLAVLFLPGTVRAEAFDDLEPERFGSDQLRLGEREIYLHCPDGLARSRLTSAMTNKRLGRSATSRNWNTVSKLAVLGEN